MDILNNTLYRGFVNIRDSFLLANISSVAQWKRAGPITQRSVDRNHSLLILFYYRSSIVLIAVDIAANKTIAD